MGNDVTSTLVDRVEYALLEYKRAKLAQATSLAARPLLGPPPARSISTAELTVINAAKAWYRGLIRGEARVKKRKEIVQKLPAPERRLAQMVANMLEAESRR